MSISSLVSFMSNPVYGMLFVVITYGFLLYLIVNRIKKEKGWSEAIDTVFLDNPIIIILALPGIVLIIVYLYAITIASSIDVTNQTLLSLLDISCSMLIAYITLLYVLYTRKILKQSEKSIQQAEKSIAQSDKHHIINYIQRQIEEFYYPLRIFYDTHVFVKYQPNPNRNASDRIQAIELADHLHTSNANAVNVKNIRIVLNGNNFENEHNRILIHKYLSRSESINLFNNFFSLIGAKDNEFDLKSMESFLKEIDNTIDADLEYLSNKLFELVGGQ